MLYRRRRRRRELSRRTDRFGRLRGKPARKNNAQYDVAVSGGRARLFAASTVRRNENTIRFANEFTRNRRAERLIFPRAQSPSSDAVIVSESFYFRRAKPRQPKCTRVP